MKATIANPHKIVNIDKKAPIKYEAFILLDNGMFSGYSGIGNNPQEATKDAKQWLSSVVNRDNT